MPKFNEQNAKKLLEHKLLISEKRLYSVLRTPSFYNFYDCSIQQENTF